MDRTNTSGSREQEIRDAEQLHLVVRRARRIRSGVRAGHAPPVSGQTNANLDVDCELGSAW